MKKPTIEDLTRIKNELQEMLDYFVEVAANREMRVSEENVNLDVYQARDSIESALTEIDDLREDVIDDC